MSEHTILQGASYTREINVSGEDPPANATTHYRLALGPSDQPLLKIENADITVSDGKYTIPISAEQTKELPAGGLYEELYEVAEGVRNVLYSDTILVRPAQVAQHEEAGE